MRWLVVMFLCLWATTVAADVDDDIKSLKDDFKILQNDLTVIKIDVGIIKVDLRNLRQEDERTALRKERSTATLYGGIGVMFIIIQGGFVLGKYVLNGRIGHAGKSR